MLLDAKTVLITGASRGIGRGTALECARQGADLALNWYRDREGIDETMAEVKALGRRVVEVECDVAERSSAAQFVGKAVEELGRVRRLCQQCGYLSFHAFLDTPQEVFGAYPGRKPQRRVLHDSGRRESNEGPGTRRLHHRHKLHQRTRRRRHASPLHTYESGGALDLMQSCARLRWGPTGSAVTSVMPGTIANGH